MKKLLLTSLFIFLLGATASSFAQGTGFIWDKYNETKARSMKSADGKIQNTSLIFLATAERKKDGTTEIKFLVDGKLVEFEAAIQPLKVTKDADGKNSQVEKLGSPEKVAMRSENKVPHDFLSDPSMTTFIAPDANYLEISLNLEKSGLGTTKVFLAVDGFERHFLSLKLGGCNSTRQDDDELICMNKEFSTNTYSSIASLSCSTSLF